MIHNSDRVDKTFKCIACGNDFVFSVGEQQFFADRGFVNDPKRCGSCRKHRKDRDGGRDEEHRQNLGAPDVPHTGRR